MATNSVHKPCAIFAIFTPYESVLGADDRSVFFQYLKGRCHGKQFCVVPDFFARSRSISGSAGLIFTIFVPYRSY